MPDPRLEAKLVIRRNPENGRRQILVNGETFPLLTQGDIDVEPVVDWGGAAQDPVVVGYRVHMTCFVPMCSFDPSVLRQVPLGQDGAQHE